MSAIKSFAQGMALALLIAGDALAQPAFPSKPIQLVVPFSSGNAINDTVARLLAPHLGEQLGQPVVIINRPGANGAIGTEQVARAAGDGYTILISSPSTHITAALLSRELPYDPRRDFTPISALVEPVTAIAVASSFPAQSLRELIDYAKRNPGKLSYSSTGIGSVFHLAGETLNQAAGLDLLHVPYKANQQALTDIMAGRISLLLNPVLLVAPQARAGKLRMLAIMEGRRFSALPDVPTVQEVVPSFEKPPSWLGFFAPARLPAPVLATWHGAVVSTLRLPDVRTRLEEGGMAIIGNSPAEFAQLIDRGFDLYGRAVKLAGLRPE